MIQINNPADCCGCTACASVCNHQAITMQPDKLGFLYPVVNKGLCTDCGLCEKICSFKSDYDTTDNFPEPKAYGARHKDMRQVETSRSGAAFIALSDWIIDQGGVVYGVGYVNHFRVAHKCATTKEERDEFKGSKYVQSDMGDTFKKVKQDLKDGKLVMFSGTPCQTAGLKSFVGKSLGSNLYLVDIVCHGVPSPYIWRDYIAYLEKNEGKTITAVDFRDKKHFGWAAHKESFMFGEKYVASDTYTYAFFQHIMLRHSCGKCHFSNIHRPSDITIADFWGWKNTDAQFNADNKGVNLMLVNTNKGKYLLEEVYSSMNMIQVQLCNCLQPNLLSPSGIHSKRKEFEDYYSIYGFVKAFKKFALIGEKKKIKMALEMIIAKFRRLYKRLF